MKDLKKMLYKFCLVGAIIVGLNFVYRFFFYENDIQQHSKIINKIRDITKDSGEIVYLGESSNITFRNDDLDKRAISDFIADYFPSKKMGAITYEASHAGIFYQLLTQIPTSSKVKTIIVTLNLRSFNAQWIYSFLETPLQKSMVLLKDNPPLFNRLLLAFKGYDIKTDDQREKQFINKWKHEVLKFPFPYKYHTVYEWEQVIQKEGIKNKDGTINPKLTELAGHYVKAYAFQIDIDNNPRIRDFDKIVELAKKRNWNLVLNLMAENTEKAKTLVGDELLFLMKQNRDLLVNRYRKEKVIVVDNLEDVPDQEFIDQTWTTEHYAEKGRKIVAKNVADGLKKIYPKEYVKVEYKLILKNEFYNDCEGKIAWSNMQTLTSEAHYSGNKSSKTGKEDIFSLTFEYPIKYIADSIKSISIECRLFQESAKHNAKLAIELSGDQKGYKMIPIQITDMVKTPKTWQKLNYLFKVPADFFEYDLLKVYIYNPTNTIIYVDDFTIKFVK